MRSASAVKSSIRTTALVMVALLCCSALAQPRNGTLLKPDQLEKLLPATVYYDGQTAPIQLRNSGGVRFPDGHYVLATLVDTSGYSSNLASRYQGYLLTEVPLTIGTKRLAAGAYGIGFLPGDKFLVTDVAGEEILTAHTETDAQMARPRPLQVLASDGGFRLYAGRSYVTLGR